MSMNSAAAMQASVGLDVSRYESRSRSLVATTQKMAANVNQAITGISRSVEGAGVAFDRLRASIDPAYAATLRYRQVQQDLAAMVERGDASQRAANLVLEQAASRYMGVATAAERAEQVQREQAAAVALSTGQYEALRASLDPVYASSKRYEAATEAMTAAVKTGAITQQQANQVLDMAAQKMLGIAPATKTVTSASKGLFASVGGGRNAMKQFSFQLNQVAQQGAVTGNYMQALSVQSADMLTVFGMWGILAGGAIAVLGPLAMSLFGTDEKANSLKDTMDDLRDATDAYRAAVADASMSSADLIEKFGRYSGAARETYAVLRDLAQLDALDKLQASIQAISEMNVAADIKGFAESFETYGKYAGYALEKLHDRFNLTGEGAVALAQRIEAIGAADGPEEAAKATAELNELLKKVYGSTQDIPEQLRELARQAANGNLSAQTILATMNGVTAATMNAANAAATLAARLGAAAVSDAAAAKDRLQVIQAQISAISAGQDEVIAGKQEQLTLDREAWRQAQLANGMDEAKVDAAEQALFLDRERVIYAEQDLQLKIKARNEAEKTAKSGASASDKLAKQFQREAEALRASLDPLEAYRQKLAKLAPLHAALSDDEWAQAIRNLNVELADSLPLVGDLSDALSTGLVDGFGGGLGKMTDALKSWLKQAIALAMKNQIVISMGLTGSVSAGGTAAAAATGGALSWASTAMSAISLGMSNFAGSLMSAAWGSISGAFSSGIAGLSTSVTTAFANLTGNVGALLSGAGSSIPSALGALGSAIGAIAGPIAIVAGLVSFFGTKTKLLDAGIKAMIEDTDVLVYTYKKVKKSRFWGLSSSTKTSTSPADAEVADPIVAAINATQASILSMASVLGVAADTFDSFTYELKVSTNGLSDEEIGKALAAAMSDAADAYSLMIDGLDDLIATGETATEALTRLSTALTTVNGAFDTLGYSLQYSGLAGAAVSSALEDLLGGADAFTSAVSTYWGTFYSEAEQQAILTRQATTALAAYNAALPRSRDEYRALIDAQDLTTEAGRALWSALVGMAGVMDQILPAVSGLTAELEDLLGAVSTSLDTTISAVTESQKAAATAAGNWYKAADSIAEFVRAMRSSAGALISPTQALSFSQAQYQTGLASALAGDLDAVNSLTGVAQTYLDNVSSTAGTAAELALAQARVLSDLGTVQGASEIEGAKWDVIQGLYQDQVDLMTEVRDYIAAGNALTEDQIAALDTQLGSLGDAIEAAAAINYASLQAQLELSVTAVEDANIPDYLKVLLNGASDGVTSYVDFVTRSDLTPDQKWLALAGASEMVKTVTYLAENDLGPQLTRLALSDISTLQKTVNLLAGAGLDDETMQLALAGSSELARQVTATLASDADPRAMRLALGTLGSYGVTVMAALSAGTGADVRSLLGMVSGSASGTLTLGGSFSFDPSTAFSVWYERTTTANITAPMTTLRDALADLAAAVRAETARAAHASTVSNLNTYAAGLTANADGSYFVTDADLAAMAGIIGLDTTGKTAAQIRAAIARYDTSDLVSSTVYDPTGRREAAYVASLTPAVEDPTPALSRSDYTISRRDIDGRYKTVVTGPLGTDRMYHDIWQAWNDIDADIARGVPSFARGGAHAGGLRLVGEEGPELEATGPSRIYSAGQTRQMLGGANEALIAEVKALREELRALREESRQLGLQTADNTRTSAKIARKWDTIGQPPVQGSTA